MSSKLPTPFAAALERRRGRGTYRATNLPEVRAYEAPSGPVVPVVVVSADQLFPTPRELAARLCAFALDGARPRVLEPSSGTGVLVRAVLEHTPGAQVAALELNYNLAKATGAECCDFLEWSAPEPFDAIVMNPPFSKGADVRHVRHAATMLAPGGRLAAVMSAGVTFRSDRLFREFREWADEAGGHIEPLPDDTFRECGTSVRTVLFTLAT